MSSNRHQHATERISEERRHRAGNIISLNGMIRPDLTVTWHAYSIAGPIGFSRIGKSAIDESVLECVRVMVLFPVERL